MGRKILRATLGVVLAMGMTTGFLLLASDDMRCELTASEFFLQKLAGLSLMAAGCVGWAKSGFNLAGALARWLHL